MLTRPQQTPALSVVVPAFNEAARLPRTLDATAHFLDARGDDYEIVVVDDGSTDATADAARAWAGVSTTGAAGLAGAVAPGGLAGCGAALAPVMQTAQASAARNGIQKARRARKRKILCMRRGRMWMTSGASGVAGSGSGYAA